MQDWRSFAQLSLHLSLALIPTSLVHLSSLYLSAFLHSIFLLSTPPLPPPLSLSGWALHFLITMGDWVYKEEEEEEEGGEKELGREGGKTGDLCYEVQEEEERESELLLPADK